MHSKLGGDDAIVYDNQRSRITYEDQALRVFPGLAHLSNRPFGRSGMWGFPWRESREFVGRVHYGVGYVLWNPVAEVHLWFPQDFRTAVKALLLCTRRQSSPLHCLQDEVIFYILNMCKHDWFKPPQPPSTIHAQHANAAITGERMRRRHWSLWTGFSTSLRTSGARASRWDSDASSPSTGGEHAAGSSVSPASSRSPRRELRAGASSSHAGYLAHPASDAIVTRQALAQDLANDFEDSSDEEEDSSSDTDSHPCMDVDVQVTDV